MRVYPGLINDVSITFTPVRLWWVMCQKTNQQVEEALQGWDGKVAEEAKGPVVRFCANILLLLSHVQNLKFYKKICHF